MKRFFINIGITLGLGMGLVLATLWALNTTLLPISYATVSGVSTEQSRQSRYRHLQTGNVITVCPAVVDTCDYADIQAAVDVANDRDIIKIASGTYTKVNNYGGVAQIIYISKTVTIRGGYTITNGFADPPAPDTDPTILDARGQGRVLYITGDVSPTVEGLHLTGGNTNVLLGNDGGGVYIAAATVVFSNNKVFSNTAAYYGGGLYLLDSVSTLRANTFNNNTADEGGGIYLENSDAILENNSVTYNNAGYGGGIHLENSDATLRTTIVSSNTAQYGGGLHLRNSDATLISNTINYNEANTSSSSGGGLYLYASNATITENTITFNQTENHGGGLYVGYTNHITVSGNVITTNRAYHDGGGLCFFRSKPTVEANTITHNTADRQGGGVLIHDCESVTLTSNTISYNDAAWGGGGYSDISNSVLIGNAIIANTTSSYGGGLYFNFRSKAVLINNIIAENEAGSDGSGVYIIDSSAQFLHTTIAHNTGGEGTGVSVRYNWGGPTSAVLTNTILVSHTTGISVGAYVKATLDGTLWGSGVWANDADWGGGGTVVTGTVNLWSDPVFLAPGAGDYHIGLTSAAIDKGIDTGIDYDMDGEPRPNGSGYDLGADEYSVSLIVTKQATPDPVQPGAPLTYTVCVTNTSSVDLHATITDTLPVHITSGETSGGTSILPGGVITWTPTIAAFGGIWIETIIVTVEESYQGSLTNLVEVTTEEGATGKATVIVNACKIYLPLVLKS